MRVTSYICPHCGASLSVNENERSVRCSFCNTVFTVENTQAESGPSDGLTHFTDQNNRVDIAVSVVPSGYRTGGVFTPNRLSRIRFYTVEGQAVSPDGRIQMFFANGDAYVFAKQSSPMYQVNFMPGQRDENGSLMMYPCSLREQLQYYAESIVQEKVQPVKSFSLSPQRQQEIEAMMRQEYDELQREIQRAQMQAQVQTQIQVQNLLCDSGIEVFRSSSKLIATAGWRTGYETAAYIPQMNMFGGMMNMFGGMGNMFGNAQPNNQGSGFGYADASGAFSSSANWSMPFIFWMLCDEDAAPEAIRVFSDFVNHFRLSEQIQQFNEQTKGQLRAEADQNTQRTNAMIDQAWQQHNARWRMAEQMRDRLSADLDRFHANTWDTIQQNDAWRSSLSQNNSSFDSSSGQESLDDRVQRWRHESMMDVNTYEREDGTTTEFSTQADRVFEQNLDHRNQFGTENYYDDYVPDGWSELNRKK